MEKGKEEGGPLKKKGKLHLRLCTGEGKGRDSKTERKPHKREGRGKKKGGLAGQAAATKENSTMKDEKEDWRKSAWTWTWKMGNGHMKQNPKGG